MLNTRASLMKTQAWIGLALFAVAVLVARELGVEIVAGQTRVLEFVYGTWEPEVMRAIPQCLRQE